MKYTLLFTTALFMALGQAQPISAQSPADLVRQGVEAQGGVNALRALKTYSAKVDAKHWEPGQSHSVNGEARFLGDSTITITSEPGKSVRRDWDRDMKYPAVERLKFSEVRYPTYGAVIDEKGEAKPMSGIRLAADIREGLRGGPLLLLRALDAPQNIAAIADQRLGEQTLPAVQFTQGPNKYIILFDRTTKLPVAVRTRDDDHIFGDSNYDLVLSDWKDVGGIKLAHTRSYRLGDIEVQRLTYREFTANPTVTPATFAIPDAVRASAKAAATADVPHQWVLRRMFLGRFLDSDAVYFPPGGSFKLVELAPNVQHVQGGGANNLVINMRDGIVVVDAPVNEGQSRAVIDLAKAKYPGKPIKNLVLTHHHMDHTGGMRTYVAEGATVIVPAPTKAYFEKVARAPHALEPDAQQKANKPVNIQEVRDSLTLKDDTVEINLHNIDNPHSEGMIIVHVVKENVVFTTDILSPRGPVARTPGTVAVGNALRKHNITGATIAGGHGTTAKQAEITTALAAN